MGVKNPYWLWSDLFEYEKGRGVELEVIVFIILSPTPFLGGKLPCVQVFFRSFIYSGGK